MAALVFIAFAAHVVAWIALPSRTAEKSTEMMTALRQAAAPA